MGTGNMRFKFTQVLKFEFNRNTQNVLQLSVIGNDIPEFANLAPNFEAYRFTTLRVRIKPRLNIASTGFGVIRYEEAGGITTTAFDNQLPPYVMLPWHQEPPSDVNNDINKYLSIDKAKYYKGTQSGQQVYKLSTLVATTASGASEAVVNTEVNWRPRIEINRSIDSIKVKHYGGIVVWDKMLVEDPKGERPPNAAYDVIFDVWGTFYNQKTLL